MATNSSWTLAEEGRLVARARAGEAAAFEALLERHAAQAYGLALRTLGDAREAEDLVQEAFLRAWRGLAGFRAEARFGTWLYRIVVNLCYKRLPGIRASLETSDLEALDFEAGAEPGEAGPAPEGTLLGEDLRRHLHAAIDGLPEAYRMLISLRHQQDLPYSEIAAITGLPLGTVKTGLHRARRRLQAALEDYERAANQPALPASGAHPQVPASGGHRPLPPEAGARSPIPAPSRPAAAVDGSTPAPGSGVVSRLEARHV